MYFNISVTRFSGAQSAREIPMIYPTSLRESDVQAIVIHNRQSSK